MRLVEEAVESIPEQFRDRLANVDFVIEENPAGRRVEGGELLLGLYQERPPDRAGRRLLRGPARPDRAVPPPHRGRPAPTPTLAELVREVVIHEVARYFGIDDDRLDELGW